MRCYLKSEYEFNKTTISKNLMRKFWHKIHLWLGLSVGTIVVLMGLTGSSLVFYKFLEEKIYSDVFLVKDYQIAQQITITKALEIAEAKYPDKTVLGVFPPRHKNATYIAYRSWKIDPNKSEFSLISIHPVSGEILGEKIWGQTVMTFIYDLHYTLLMPKYGKIIVGFIGIFFLLTMFVGIYLWIPQNGNFKQALWFKKGAGSHRRNLDIHRVSGIYPMIILVVIAFSGIYMCFPKQVKSIVSVFSTLSSDVARETKIVENKNDKIISYDQALKAAQKEFPDYKVTDFDRPNDENPIVVSFKSPDHPRENYGYNQVLIHPYTGEVIALRKYSDASLGDKFIAWQFPLHNGEAFGIVGRCIIFIMGFIPAILYVTGILMWLKGRSAKRKVNRQQQSLN